MTSIMVLDCEVLCVRRSMWKEPYGLLIEPFKANIDVGEIRENKSDFSCCCQVLPAEAVSAIATAPTYAGHSLCCQNADKQLLMSGGPGRRGSGGGGRASEKGSLIRNQYWQGDAGYHRRFAF